MKRIAYILSLVLCLTACRSSRHVQTTGSSSFREAVTDTVSSHITQSATTTTQVTDSALTICNLQVDVDQQVTEYDSLQRPVRTTNTRIRIHHNDSTAERSNATQLTQVITDSDSTKTGNRLTVSDQHVQQQVKTTPWYTSINNLLIVIELLIVLLIAIVIFIRYVRNRYKSNLHL